MNAEHLAEARRMGVEAAKAAASRTVDGNMTQDHIARMIRWLDDGDPRADNYLPNCPNLSGEWADDPTPMSLYREITGRDPDDPADGLAFETLHGCMIDALADAWEAGVSDTFMQECERELRNALEDTSEDRCTDHGLEVCPDCGNAGTAIGPQGYYRCTRFLTCWADVD